MPVLARIYGDAVETGTSSFELERPDTGEMVERWRTLVDTDHPYLVAEDGGAAVGFAYAGIYRGRPAYRSTVENSVYVRPDCHGRGIGRQLLNSLIDEAAARQYRQMVAVIGDSNNLASVRLHAAAGFTLVGTFRNVGWKHGRWLDTVLMQRPLGLGADAPSAHATP